VQKGGKSDPAALAKQLARLRGTGSGTVGTGGASAALTSLVGLRIVEDELARAGGTVTGADRKAVRDQVKTQLQQAGVKSDQASSAFVDTEIDRQAALQALARAVTKGQDRTAELRAAYAGQRDNYTQLCFTPITTNDEASAQAAVSRARAGEDFAVVAAQVSTTKAPAGSSGSAQCAARADVAAAIPEAAAAGVGDLLGPANNQGTWIVLKVDQVKVPSFDDIRDQLEQALPPAGAKEVQTRVTKATRAAEVSVDPRYGRWNPTRGEVAAPVGPMSTTTVAPVTATGS